MTGRRCGLSIFSTSGYRTLSLIPREPPVRDTRHGQSGSAQASLGRAYVPMVTDDGLT